MSNTSATITGLYTIVRKDIVRMLRIATQTLVPPVITTTLYFLVFGKLIGSQISKMHGYSYMEYIMPGLVMMTMITSAYMHTSSSMFFQKFQKSIEELLVSPLPRGIIVLGFILGGVIRSCAVGVLVLIVALLFTKISIASIPLVLFAGICTSFIFASAGFINGLLAKGFDSISIVPTFVLTPLTYLGGVFYSVTMLPPFFHALSLWNPILYMVNTFRFGFLGVSDVSVLTSIALLTLLAVLFYGIATLLFVKGVGLDD